jgi:hypothetical protein
VFARVASAKKQGETDERLHNVVAWRETPFFTEAERAALALTEAATRIQDGAPGVTDEIWDDATTHFGENQMSAIILEIALTNFFNQPHDSGAGRQDLVTWAGAQALSSRPRAGGASGPGPTPATATSAVRSPRSR